VIKVMMSSMIKSQFLITKQICKMRWTALSEMILLLGSPSGWHLN